MTGIFMGVYLAWAVMTVMSGRVFLNLVFAVHGRERGTEGATTAGIPTFHTRSGRYTEGGEPGPLETFGAKRMRRGVPLTTFSTVSISFSSLYFSVSLLRLISFFQTILSIDEERQGSNPVLLNNSSRPNTAPGVER
jgi:hypothetical protein